MFLPATEFDNGWLVVTIVVVAIAIFCLGLLWAGDHKQREDE